MTAFFAKSDPDSILVAAAGAGDAGAFDVLVGRHEQVLRRFLRARLDPDLDADDVAQEAFVGAWRELPDFQGCARFKTWLFAIAPKLCASATRRELRARAHRACLDEIGRDPRRESPLWEGFDWIAVVDRTRTHFSIQSLMGVMMMIGIAVSFNVLLTDLANRLRREGDSWETAIRQAASIRLRPKMMTSLVAIFGLLPMAIAGGANIPLARAVIGGVITSTLLTMFVLPVLYTIIKRRAPAPAPVDGSRSVLYHGHDQSPHEEEI